MSRSFSKKLVTLGLVVAGSVFTMGGSCLNPCEQLAQKICSCLPTEAERQSCTRETAIQRDQPSRQLSQEDRIFCTQRLGECECRDINEGNLKACGLTRE